MHIYISLLNKSVSKYCRK